MRPRHHNQHHPKWRKRRNTRKKYIRERNIATCNKPKEDSEGILPQVNDIPSWMVWIWRALRGAK